MAAGFEDLRGKRLRWSYRRGFPLDVSIDIEGFDSGRVWKPTNLKPEFLATLGGIDWRIQDGRRRKRLGFSDSSLWFATADSHLFGFGEEPVPKSVLIDEVRTYRFGLVEATRTDLYDATGQHCLSFRRERKMVAGKEGWIDCMPSVDPLDAPPLMLLGLLYAFEGGLYRADPNLLR